MKFLFLRLLLLFSPLFIFANTAYYKVIKVRSNDTLNVRIDRNIHAQKIGELPYNAKRISVMQCKNAYSGEKWCQIVYHSQGATIKGWVSAKYITVQKKTSTPAVSTKRYKIIGIESNDTLSVRRKAGTQYYKVGDLAYNAKRIKVLKCTYSSKGGKWCKIRHHAYGSTLIGWVSAKYLKSYSSHRKAQKYPKQKYPAYESACRKGDSTACFYLSSVYEGRSKQSYHAKGCRLLKEEYEDYAQREYYQEIRQKIRHKLQNHACL